MGWSLTYPMRMFKEGGPNRSRGHGMLGFNPNVQIGSDLRLYSVTRLYRISKRLATPMIQGTEAKLRDLRQRAHWLKRYVADNPHIAGVLTIVIDDLDAEANALDADPIVPTTKKAELPADRTRR